MFKPRLKKIVIPSFTFETDERNKATIINITVWLAQQGGESCFGISPADAYNKLLQRYKYYHEYVSTNHN